MFQRDHSKVFNNLDWADLTKREEKKINKKNSAINFLNYS